MGDDLKQLSTDRVSMNTLRGGTFSVAQKLDTALGVSNVLMQIKRLSEEFGSAIGVAGMGLALNTEHRKIAALYRRMVKLCLITNRNIDHFSANFRLWREKIDFDADVTLAFCERFAGWQAPMPWEAGFTKWCTEHVGEAMPDGWEIEWGLYRVERKPMLPPSSGLSVKVIKEEIERVMQENVVDQSIGQPDPSEMAAPEEKQPNGTHRRAGITKNKNRGVGKVRRVMARASRRRNRG